MRAETAIVTINGEVTLKVVLQAETEAERVFLEEAMEKCEDYKLSAIGGIWRQAIEHELDQSK